MAFLYFRIVSDFPEISRVQNLSRTDLAQFMQDWRSQVEKDALPLKLSLPDMELPPAAIQTWASSIENRLILLTPSQRMALAYAADIAELNKNNHQAAIQLLQRCFLKVLTRRHFSNK